MTDGALSDARLVAVATGRRPRVWRRIIPEDVQIRAAGVAFYAFLALLPGMLAVVMLFGSLADPGHLREQLAMLEPLFPP
jgi:membrane protein